MSVKIVNTKQGDMTAGASSGIPDCTESRDTATHHSIHYLLGNGLIGDNHNGLRVELPHHAVSEFDHVRASMHPGV